MWKQSSHNEREKFINDAFDILKDESKTRESMLSVIDNWPISCACCFTARGNNKNAWLGQAACALMVDSTEDATKLAWAKLSKSEQDTANSVATKIITIWKGKYNA